MTKNEELQLLDEAIADYDATIELLEDTEYEIEDQEREEKQQRRKSQKLFHNHEGKVVYYDYNRRGYWIGDNFISDADILMTPCASSYRV